eukprot:1893870-Amphidinium_carterae.1
METLKASQSLSCERSFFQIWWTVRAGNLTENCGRDAPQNTNHKHNTTRIPTQIYPKKFGRTKSDVTEL